MDELKLKVLAPAQWELEEIALVHLNLVGPASARKITDSIYDALELLRSHPQMGVMMNGIHIKPYCGKRVQNGHIQGNLSRKNDPP